MSTSDPINTDSITPLGGPDFIAPVVASPFEPPINDAAPDVAAAAYGVTGPSFADAASFGAVDTGAYPSASPSDSGVTQAPTYPSASDPASPVAIPSPTPSAVYPPVANAYGVPNPVPVQAYPPAPVPAYPPAAPPVANAYGVPNQYGAPAAVPNPYAPAPVYPGGYPAPLPYGVAYTPFVPVSKPASGLGVAGGVCGIVGLVFCWVPVFGFLIALTGVILGGVGIARGNQRGESIGMGVAGVACGLVAIIPAIAIMAAVFSLT